MADRLQTNLPTILSENAAAVSYDDGTANALSETASMFSELQQRAHKQDIQNITERAVKDGERAGLDQGVDFEPVEPRGIYNKVFNQSALEVASVDLDIKMREAVRRISKEHPMSPEAQKEAFENFSDGFAAELPEEMIVAFRTNMDKFQLASITQAENARTQFQQEQARAKFLFLEDSYFQDINALVRPMFDSGKVSEASAIAVEQMRKNYADHLLNNGPGVPFNVGGYDFPGNASASRAFSVGEVAEKIRAFDEALEQKIIETGVVKIANATGNPQGVLDNFIQGELFLDIPTQDGIVSTNVLDAANGTTRRIIEGQIKSTIAQRNKVLTDQRNLRLSNYDLAIATAQDDPIVFDNPNLVGPRAPSVSKAEKLSNIMQMIERDPIFNDIDGQIKRNGLRKKIFTQMEEETEKTNSFAMGAAFASGDAYLNPADTDAKKAYNEYYETIEPRLTQLQPFERNIALTNIVSNSKQVPDRLTGEIQVAARSQDVEVIKNAADLMDRIAVENPHLVNDLAPQKDLARIQMINDRIERGLEATEAIKTVDQLLEPKNQITVAQASQELKAAKVDYRAETIQAFDSAGFFKEVFTLGFANGLDTEGGEAQAIIDSVSGAYRAAYEDRYTLTRDQKLSKKYAEDFIKGTYGVSEVNGGNTIMPYPPEKYYGIPNTDNAWMRSQMIEDAQKFFKDSLNPPSKKQLRDNLILMNDPNLTKRTATVGAPRYQLMLRQKDGTLLKIGGAYWFDAAKQREKMVNNAVKRKEIMDSDDNSLTKMLKIRNIGDE